MKILVTGASGLLGANLSYTSAASGLDVLATYNEHKVAIKGCPMSRLDLLASDFSEVKRFRPECIVHCAAYTNVDGCETDRKKAHLLNVEATARLAEISKDIGSRFIFMSTDSIFDGKTPLHTESEEACPLNFYSRTKVEAERIVKDLENHVIVRTNFYGFNIQEKQSFSEWLHAKFLKGEGVPGFTDFFFSPIIANNLAEAILEIAENDFTGVLHVAGDGRISKYDFALRFAELFGFDKALVKPTKMGETNLKAPRPHDCSLDISKAKRLLKTRILNIDEGIKYYKELYDSGYQEKLRGG